MKKNEEKKNDDHLTIPYIRLLSGKYPSPIKKQNDQRDSIKQSNKNDLIKMLAFIRNRNTKLYDIKSHLKYLDNQKYLSTLS